MKKRVTFMLCLLMLISSALSACSTSKNQSENSGQSVSSGSEKSVSDKKVTLNVAVWSWNDEAKKMLNNTLDIFKKDHPNVTVQITDSPFPDYWNKLKTSVAGGGGPDVFWMNGPNFYRYAADGLIKDIQPMISADATLEIGNYAKPLVDLYTYKDHLYGLPYFLDSIALFYNKELFDKANIKYPDETWTWDTLKENGAKLSNKDEGVYGYVAPIGNQNGYYNLIYQAGGFVVSPDKTKSGFDAPEAISAFKWMKDLMDQGISPTAQQQLETDPGKLFGSGKVAMIPGISTVGVQYYQMLGDKLGVAPLPQGQRKASIVHGLSWVINNKTKHEKEAWELLKVLSGSEAENLLAKTGLATPALKGTEGGWVKSIPSLNLQVFIDSLEFGVPYPISKNTAQWQEVESKEIQDAFLGKKTIEDATKSLATKMNEILQKEQAEK